MRRHMQPVGNPPFNVTPTARQFLDLIKRRATDCHSFLSQPELNLAFDSVESCIRMMHEELATVLLAIHESPEQFEPVGLRLTMFAWVHNRPNTGLDAIREVLEMISRIEPLMNRTIGTTEVGTLPVNVGSVRRNGLNELLNNMGFDTREPRDDPSEEEDSSDSSDEEGEGNIAQHVRGNGFLQIRSRNTTLEEISTLGSLLATQEDVTDTCSICLANFVCGEQLRVLHCSHKFHVPCIDQWLIQSMTCPIDRGQLFPNSS